ncbi:hypothetical protein AVEN_239485-1 [Araneus ventricosus]|uniref:Helitron helicase-like domain-containing protein n=1 Tax=Araneus ventricosus TaxID=182803 RepID=A0A4Y2N7N7_ARAVE|nr:hypothetical protein AVEN_239485-1 [Araneus ventricosus]
MDNRFAVPYKPYLLLKYNAHINVEVSTSLHAMKYIYKYIYKGFDFANIVLSAGQVQYNEIANYIERTKRVTFKDGHEEEALEAARSRQTMLESWFQLNQSDPDAQTLLNTGIRYNYVYDRNNWKRRKRGGNKIVARMYVLNVKDAE